MRRVAVLCLGVVALALAGAAPAWADVFGPISLLSASPFQQFSYAHDPTISGNGQFVVFDGSIGGVTGVWRAELLRGAAGQPQTATLEQVAGGDAALPSVSWTGQYVSFTTNEGAALGAITDERALAPPADHELPNVYVRNMALRPAAQGAFALASAENGSTKELAYEETAEERAEGEFGSMAAGRSAISENGEKVAFVTTAASDLAGPETPPLQVAVRNLHTDETQLVSVKDDPATGAPAFDAQTGQPEPVPEEAVFTQTGKPPPFRPTPFYELPTGVGASISGDGTTVAWMGENVGEQIRTLADERLSREGGAPLWRRIAGGEHEPTRPITGGPDLENPACAAHPENSLQPGHPLSDPCQGPFRGELVMSTRSSIDSVPQLSANGYTVAFLSNASLVTQGEDYGGAARENTDLYVADMHPGLTRVQALRPLTELASGEQSRLSTNGTILDAAVSPNGEQVAFTTMRTIFPLGSLTYVSVPAAVPGLAELYDVDLADNTLTRVTRGYEGGAAAHPYREEGFEDPYDAAFSNDDGALSPSFSEDDLLAFSSTASNLVYGDGNTPNALTAIGTVPESDGSDVFVAERLQYPPDPTAQIISAAPGSPPLEPQWQLGVTAETLAGGRVRLYVTVPAAGTLSALASSPVEVRAARAARSARRGHPKASRVTAAVRPRTVASASRFVEATAAGGAVMLQLTLAAPYRTLAARIGGLSADVNLTFVSAGHPALHESVEVSFRESAARAAARGSRRAQDRDASSRRSHDRGTSARRGAR